jgi:hypothetical protein
MNSLSEFEKAWAMLKPVVEEVKEYRLHYNELGIITMCTMQNHPKDTTYIVVSQDEYDNYFRYTIVDGKLKKIDTGLRYSVQLKKSNSGYLVVKNHAGLLIEPDETFSETEYYDTANN